MPPPALVPGAVVASSVVEFPDGHRATLNEIAAETGLPLAAVVARAPVSAPRHRPEPPQKPAHPFEIALVPAAGLELARPLGQGILRPELEASSRNSQQHGDALVPRRTVS
jgi:hypothetical protein